MALDRQSIEKKDFPIGRRGYEPEAVDAHLAQLAAEVERLQGSPQRRGGESLAVAASEQVRAIVEAAEASAADIERQARDEASRIRSEAQADAASTRDTAVARSEEHVGKVAESTQMMLQRIDAMEGELGALIESLRTGANRLNADLTLLHGNMGDLYGAAGGGPPQAEAAAAADPQQVVAEVAPEMRQAHEQSLAEQVAAEDPVPDPAADVVAPAEAPRVDPEAPAPAQEPAAAEGGDVEGARLIALNMALNGTSREETDAYLRDNFDLADRQALLDEVYATVG